MNRLSKRITRRSIGQVVVIAVVSAIALPASAQQGMQRPGAGNSQGTANSTVSPPPRASSSFDRGAPPPIQAPSVDNNPNAYRGQSMYPPRANADQR
jgi:hypothetical protein